MKLTCAVDRYLHHRAGENQRSDKKTHRDSLAKAPGSGNPVFCKNACNTVKTQQTQDSRQQIADSVVYNATLWTNIQNLLIDTLPCIHLEQPRV